MKLKTNQLIAERLYCERLQKTIFPYSENLTIRDDVVLKTGMIIPDRRVNTLIMEMNLLTLEGN